MSKLMKKNLLIILALLMTINSLAQEPALYHVTYDCEAKSAAGAAKLYRWSLDIGKTTAVFYNDNERGFNEDLAKFHVNGDPIRALEQMDALNKKYPTKNSCKYSWEVHRRTNTPILIAYSTPS